MLRVFKEDPLAKPAPLTALAGSQCLKSLPRHGYGAQQGSEYFPYVGQLARKFASRRALSLLGFLDELSQQRRPVVLAVKNASDRMVSIRLDKLWYAVANELVVGNSHAGTVCLVPTRACPRDVPEPPSTVSDDHEHQPADVKLERPLNARAMHENTLVTRSPRAGGRALRVPVRAR